MAKMTLSDSAQFLKERLRAINPADREKEITSLYVALRTIESDCDKAQGTLRTIASAWLLATIGGIGFFIQGEYSTSARIDQFSAAGLRQMLLAVSTMGLISLWYVDQRIYQRLLHGPFAVGCWMEEEFRAILPPVRLYVYRLNLDITTYLAWFYRAPVLMLLLAASINLAVFDRTSDATELQSSLLAIVWVLQVATVALVLVNERGWPSLRGELPARREGTAPAS